MRQKKDEPLTNPNVLNYLGKGQLKGHLAMLIFSMLVAGSFSLGGQMANMVPPDVTIAVRFTIAALVLGVLAMMQGHFKADYFNAPWRFPILGGIMAFYFVLMFESLKTATPISTSAVFTLTPFITAVIGYILLRQVTTQRMAIAIIIGAIGAIWVIFRADFAAMLRFEIGRGEIIFFIGVVIHAFYPPMSRKLNRGEPALITAFGMSVGGAMILWLISFEDILAIDWLSLPSIFWWGLIYLSVMTSAVTFFLLQIATMVLPSAKAMAYTYLTPSFVILWEWAFGNGLPPIGILIGVGATILALLLLLKNEEKA